MNKPEEIKEESGYLKHAWREFIALGWCDKNRKFSCDMQKLICRNMLDLLEVFDTQGHSGSTAPYVINAFEKLASWKPLGPLTGADSEWNDISSHGGGSAFQNKRCPAVFKDEDGTTYHSGGRVFKEPDGCCYTSKNSRVPVTFPYTPKVIYVDASEDK